MSDEPTIILDEDRDDDRINALRTAEIALAHEEGKHYLILSVIYHITPEAIYAQKVHIDHENLRSTPYFSCYICGTDDDLEFAEPCPGWGKQ